jgi:hypothetical protein
MMRILLPKIRELSGKSDKKVNNFDLGVGLNSKWSLIRT